MGMGVRFVAAPRAVLAARQAECGLVARVDEKSSNPCNNARGYQRATWLQAPLALLSLVSGVIAWWLGAGTNWLIGALLVGAVVPFTFATIMPTNKKLLAPGRDLASQETRELLVHWGKLHAVRTLLSLAWSVVYLWEAIGAWGGKRTWRKSWRLVAFLRCVT